MIIVIARNGRSVSLEKCDDSYDDENKNYIIYDYDYVYDDDNGDDKILMMVIMITMFLMIIIIISMIWR